MKNIIFNYYEADIKRSIPLGTVNLEYVLNAIKKPKNDIKHIFEQIQVAEQNKDMATKQVLKSKLYSFTPCVLVNGSRKYANIVNFTGCLILDFDHLPNIVYAEEFKIYLFNTYKFVISAWLSASKHGVRAIVKIPICSDVTEFKHYFGAIENKLKHYNGFDTAPKNCILPMFISYDAEILTRFDALTFNEKFIPIEKPPVIQYVVTNKTSSIETIILKKINLIIDNGHPQLRAAAYLLGGYIGAGYIDKHYAIDMINKMIDCNSYLSQKASIYKVTAKTMINKGINEPTYLSK